MVLLQTAYLEIEGSDSTATFEFSIDLEHTSTLDKSYLMGERGQYLREIVNATPATGNFDEERRTGYWLDGGAGNWQIQLDFATGMEDALWGDGSGGDGPENVTQTDASGTGVKALSRLQILQYWLAKSKSDSGGTTRLHWGEWTSGNVSRVANFAAGAFGEPMYVAVIDTSFDGPELNQDVTSMSGSITMSHVSLWGGYGAPDWVTDSIGAVIDAADVIPDA